MGIVSACRHPKTCTIGDHLHKTAISVEVLVATGVSMIAYGRYGALAFLVIHLGWAS